MNKYLKEVQAVLAHQLYLDESDILPEANIYNDLGADSLDWIETLVKLEEGYLLEIPDEDAEKWKTVGDIAEYIEKAIDARS